MQKEYLIETIKARSINDITFRGTDAKEKCTTIFHRKNNFSDE